MKRRKGSVFVGILTILLCLMLIVVIFKDKIIENTINTYFASIYNVTPNTYMEIIKGKNALDFQIERENEDVNALDKNIEKYVKARMSGLYTEYFYEKYLIGNSEILTPSLAAYNSKLNIKLKNVTLKDANYDCKDKVYNFQIVLLVTEKDSGKVVVLENRGQIALKKIFLFYKIDKIKYDCNELIRYLGVETNS